MKNKKLVKYFPILAILGLLVLYVVAINNGILVFTGDSYETMYQFYVGAYRKFYDGTLFSYDFSMGLGGNPFYNTFYFLFSPFFYIILLFPLEFMPYVFLFTLVLKFLVIYFCTYLWIKQINDNEKQCIFISLLFTFGGWSLFYMHYVFFLDHLFVLPLLLYATHRYLKDNKWIYLVLSIAYIGVANYYFAYLFIPITCLYALFIVLNEEGNTFKTICIKAFKFLGLIFLGLGISCVVLLPNIYILLNNPRLGVDKNLSTMNKYEIYKTASSLFVPITSRLHANPLIDSGWFRFIGWGDGASLFMGSFTVFSLFLLVFSKNCKEKFILLGYYTMAFVFYVFPIFSYIFQGTMDTRWFILINIINLLNINYIFKNKYKNRFIDLSFVLTVISFICIVFISYHYHLTINDNIVKVSKIVLVLLIFVFGYFISFRFNKQNSLIIICCFEILFCFYVYFQNNDLLDKSYFDYSYLDSEPFEELDDGSFYRYAFDGYTYWYNNSPYAKNVNSISFYNSLYNYEMEDYIKRYKTTWSMPGYNSQDISYNLLSVKYWVTKAYNYEPLFGYEFKENINDLGIYENQHYMELGYLNDRTINYEVIKDLPYLEQDLIMNEYIVTETSDNYSYNPDLGLEIIQEINTNDSVKISDDTSDSILVFDNLSRSYLTINLYDGDGLLNSYEYYGQPYITISLKDYWHLRDVEIINNENRPLIMNYYHCDSQRLLNNFDRISENSFYDTKIENNYIKGKINSDKEQTCYTSIPFDKGFSVYVDGEKTDYYKVNMGFIGFDIGAGEHVVEFKYCIPYIKCGTIITIISFIIFLLKLNGKGVKCLRKLKRNF